MKIRYIVILNVTPRDRAGNVYSYFSIIDTRSGRILQGKDAPESNLSGAMFHINGGEHKQNYCFTVQQISWREFVYRTDDIEYVGCDSEVIADKFKKLLKSRSPNVRIWGK
jgi:hypothetical protein